MESDLIHLNQCSSQSVIFLSDLRQSFLTSTLLMIWAG